MPFCDDPYPMRCPKLILNTAVTLIELTWGSWSLEPGSACRVSNLSPCAPYQAAYLPSSTANSPQTLSP
eukprot:1030633-Amphidinium_carterae.1